MNDTIRRMTLLAILLALVCMTPSCESKKESEEASPEHLKLCEEAGERYSRCTKELTGIDQPPTQKNIERCAKSEKTVDMYEACLPTEGCEAFLECMDEYVER